MPEIIPDSLSTAVLYSTTRLVTTLRNGSKKIGTAFFFNFKVDDKMVVPVLMTNKHVIDGACIGTFFLHEGKYVDENGSRKIVPSETSFEVTMDNFQNRWIVYPAEDLDLCAMPFEPLRKEALSKGKEIVYFAIEENFILSDQMLNNLQALEEVTMVGYPIGLWDEVNNFPIFRRGITASHPALDFNGQPIGVLDIAAFPGSSGSPIFILNEGGYSTKEGFAVGNRIISLGTLYAGPYHTANGNIEIVEVPTGQIPIVRTQVPTHLGLYIKAKALFALKSHLFNICNINS